MPECHKCPYDGRRSRACLDCSGPGSILSSDGARVVSFDAMPPELAESVHHDNRAPEMESEAAAALAEFIRDMMALPPMTRDIVCLRYLHIVGDRNTFEDIAARYGTTPQVIEQRLARAIRRFPGLRAVFAAKVARKERRKK